MTLLAVLNRPIERTIAQGRVLFAILSLAILVWNFDLGGPYGSTAIALVGIYIGYALLLLAGRVWTFALRFAGLIFHITDIGFLAAMALITQAQVSFFYAFIGLFILLAASIRWNWPAVVATGVVLSIVVWGAACVAAWQGQLDYDDLRLQVIRGVYLMTIGGMLGFASAWREYQRERLAKLTDWPGPDPGEFESPNISRLLQHSARVLGIRRMIVLWEEQEEPFLHVVTWHDGVYEQGREIAGRYGDLMAGAKMAESVFWTDDLESGIIFTLSMPRRVTSPIFDRRLVEAFSLRSLATATFQGGLCQGRILIPDERGWGNDLPLLQIMAGRVGNALDREVLKGRAKQTAAERERTRLTRDLHDGLLQSLTAASLQITIAAENDGQEMRQRLAAVKQLLSAEQRRIREFLRGASDRPERQQNIEIRHAVEASLTEVARHWNCTASLRVDPVDARMPASLAAEVRLMLAEAVANAVRHGKARVIDVLIEAAFGGIKIHIRDDGRGFKRSPFYLSGQQLNEAGVGPISLQDRVRELAGEISVKSSPEGVELAIRLPVAA